MPPGHTVYIPNRVFHDYSDARRFGELVQLSQGSIDTMSLEDLESRFREKMKESMPHDWILLSGSPLLNVIAAHIQLEKHGAVKMLQWNAVMREYAPFELEMRKAEV